MRTVVLGIVVVITGLVIAAVAAPGPEGTGRERGGLDRVEGPCPRGVLPRSIAANNDLIAATTIVGDQYQMVTVIDTKLRVMSVYQIELASGKISLRSVRHIQWDLQMNDFNVAHPLPREIQALLDPK